MLAIFFLTKNRKNSRSRNLICIHVCILACTQLYLNGEAVLNETTTIRVSKKTAETLERLREKLNAESLDEAIQSLIKKQRKSVLEKAFSADQGRIKSFSEGDRGEDRD
jgi:predicted CopG family antitoxin